MMEYAIIVAGGSGQRMQAATPKQFIKIGNLPILMRTIMAFDRYSKDLKIILVLPENQFGKWKGLVRTHNFAISHLIVKGGETRYDSVKNGLLTIIGEGLVAIHDGVRPFITPHIIDKCFKSAEEFGSGIAAVIPKDSIRKLTESGNSNVNRNNYRLMQTPQTFEVSIIKEAYLINSEKIFTDDASVAENNGHKIHLVEGDYKNIKITTPEDIEIAQALLE